MTAWPSDGVLEDFSKDLVNSLDRRYLMTVSHPHLAEDMSREVRSLVCSYVQSGLVPADFFRWGIHMSEDGTKANLNMARKFSKYPMKEHEFREYVGRDPVNDDLKRVNCDKVGQPGHFLCGWCFLHEIPRFECGCIQDSEDDSFDCVER